MLKRSVVAAALLALAAPVFAGHCPKDVKAIDQALAAGTDLSQEELDEVKALRDEGEALHESGKHAESVETLHEAMDILGMEHQ